METAFPPRCAGCGRRGMWVCANCAPKLDFLADPLCDRCGLPPEICRCWLLPPSLDWVRSVAWYDGWLKTAIIAFKYEGEFARANQFGDLLVPLLQRVEEEATLVPVPLHPSRQQERGYNQALKLAENLSSRTRISINPVLQRTRATRQQTKLSAEDRAQNVDNAFAVRPDQVVRGRRFILLDDVMTTGSTLGECAAVLKREGAVWVGAMTIARER